MMFSRVCTAESCKRVATVLCIGCEQHFCMVHLNEHSDLLINRCIQLSDAINKVSEQVNKASSFQPTFLIELDIWQQQAHQTVDYFCEKKKQEFEDIAHKERDHQVTELGRLRNRITELIEEKAVTEDLIDSIDDSIQSLQHQADQLQFTQLTLSPLVIDDELIRIHQQTSNCKELLPLPSPQRENQLKDNWYSIAANDNFLLVKDDLKLCVLDEQLSVVKSIPWIAPYIIADMFWSKPLALFILITAEKVFAFDEKSMTIDQLPIAYNGSKKSWYCGTCTNENLFLSTSRADSSIYKYSLFPSIKLVKEYRSPIFCQEDERVQDLSSNKNALAILIENYRKEVHFDLCSSRTLERYWSLELDMMVNSGGCRCCSLRLAEWMVMNPHSSELLHISKEGKLIKKDQYKYSPIHAVQLNNHILIIMTDKSIQQYKLS